MSSIDIAAAIQAAPIGSVGIIIRPNGEHRVQVKQADIPSWYTPLLRPDDRAYIIPPDALAQYEVTEVKDDETRTR